MNDTTAPRRDKPWMFGAYAGHSTAREANKL
jgi:(2R)-ethylmalonyl-CoA mutase